MFHSNDKIGNYTLIEFLGEGQFGEVWLAEKRSRVLTTRVALKLPKSRVKFEEVEKEARVWEQAKGHPNVLPIIDADIHENQIFIASEYSPDGSLDDWLQRHDGKAPSLEAAVEMLRGILAGLEHLHKRQIIHRDLKPANILLQGEIPRITDFGIAKFLPSGTESHLIKGSPAYLAPEAWDGIRSEQTDIWSATIIFYQLVSGRMPFYATTQSGLIKAICLDDPLSLPETVPPPLMDFVCIGLEKKPTERYPNVTAMRMELQKAYQQTLRFGGEPIIVVAKPTIVAPKSASVVGEFESCRQRDGFVLIPAGEFLMGSENGGDNEKPVHRVRISSPFEMSRYQVTQELWEAIMGINPSSFKGEANLPVECVSWEDAQQFIKKLNARNDGYIYRLPTEAEWEYACRAGTSGDCAGNLDAMAWYNRNSGNRTHPTGQKKGNDWGLYDMHGNVWEWCADWYDGNFYAKSPDADPQGAPTGSTRVMRGGGWFYEAAACRSAMRDHDAPNYRFHDCGLRLVRIYSGEPTIVPEPIITN